MQSGSLLDTRPRRMWGAEITDTGFNFVIKEALYNYFLESDKFKENQFDLSQMTKEIIGEVVVFNITLPLINYPNLRRDKLNHKALNRCVKQISFLLNLLNQEFEDSFDNCFYFNNELQLVTIETGCAVDSYLGYFHIGASFSREARTLLKEKTISNSDFPDLEEITYKRYLRLSENRKREYERAITHLRNAGGDVYSIHVGISDGVPYFKVPGSCACLGAPSDQFILDGNLHDHNMDHSLQIITMLTALICFWNNVLNPLYFESLNK